MTRFADRGLALRPPGLFGPELACVAVADWLFWGRGFGLSLPLFFAAIAVTAWTVGVRRVSPTRRVLAVAVLALALAPAVDRLTPLSLAFAVFGTAFGIRSGTLEGCRGWRAETRASTLLFVRGPVQAVRDLGRRRAVTHRRSRSTDAPAKPRHWLAWVAPAVLFAVFLMLLASANPVMSRVLLDEASAWAAALTEVPRALFWLCMLAVAWPAVRMRRSRPAAPRPRIPPLTDAPAGEFENLAALLLSRRAVSRALLVLCPLLAVQLGMDGAYLWGGLTLPPDISYADYAHNGAYPLVVTALLAAALVLVVRRPGGPPVTPANAALLVVFLGENVLLVVSAMQRLALYVAAYGLTQWRVAAFAWMGLVAVGLGLVALQGVLRRDNRWLVTGGLLAALAVLYGWCLADVPRIVADYDVAHCEELQGGGPSLDLETIQGLGADAIPAIDRFVSAAPESWRREALAAWRGRMAARVRRASADWRCWSFVNWRLSRDLDRSNLYEPAVAAPDDGEDD